MGTGWRRAFCNTVPRDRREAATTPSVTEVDNKQQRPIPKLTGSNPSTPRLRCKTIITNKNADNIDLVSPKLECKTTPKSHANSPRIRLGSNPSSPRSPFSILKNTLRLSRVRICYSLFSHPKFYYVFWLLYSRFLLFCCFCMCRTVVECVCRA